MTSEKDEIMLYTRDPDIFIIVRSDRLALPDRTVSARNGAPDGINHSTRGCVRRMEAGAIDRPEGLNRPVRRNYFFCRDSQTLPRP